MKVRLFFTFILVNTFGTVSQTHCSLNEEITQETLLTDYEDFQNYLTKLNSEINLLTTAQSIVSFVPFGSKLLDNKVKKEAEKRGYNDESQKLIPVGPLLFKKKNWQSNVEKVFLNPKNTYLVYINMCKNRIKNEFDSEFGSGWTSNSELLNRSINIMHEEHIKVLFKKGKLNQQEYFYKNDLEKNGKCAFYNFLVRYEKKHEKLPVYVLLNMYLSFWFSKNGLITEVRN